MSEYLVVLCKWCHRHFMSTSRKYSKCPYCGNAKNSIIDQSNKPKLASELVRQLNAQNQI